MIVKEDSSTFSTEEDRSSPLPSKIKTTSHSKEKKDYQVTQTTLVIEDPSEAERIFSNLVNNAKEEDPNNVSLFWCFDATGAIY